MRKIINSTYVTLDGAMEHPENWSMDYFNEQAQTFATDQLMASDALLMGRGTYEGFAAAWPERSGDPFTDRMNSMAKYVVSSTLDKAGWNNTTILTGDVTEEVTKLKKQDGADILMYGYGPLAQELAEHNLLDELRLWVHPIIFGQGEPSDLIFRGGRDTVMFKHVGTTTFDNGVLINAYKPAST